MRFLILRPDARHVTAATNAARRCDGSAIADCTKAIALDPKNLFAYFTRGKAYHLNKESTKAIQDFDRAESLNEPYLFYFRGKARLALDQPKAADKDFRLAVKLHPPLESDIELEWVIYRTSHPSP